MHRMQARGEQGIAVSISAVPDEELQADRLEEVRGPFMQACPVLCHHVLQFESVPAEIHVLSSKARVCAECVLQHADAGNPPLWPCSADRAAGHQGSG